MSEHTLMTSRGRGTEVVDSEEGESKCGKVRGSGTVAMAMDAARQRRREKAEGVKKKIVKNTARVKRQKERAKEAGLPPVCFHQGDHSFQHGRKQV